MAAIMKKLMEMFTAENTEDNEDYVEETEREGIEVKKDNSKVLSIYRGKNKISCFKPMEYDKCVAEIADSLISGSVVVVDFGIEDTNPEIAQRIIDFLSGTTYAVQGKFFRVASTCILAPNNVEVDGLDLVNELKNDNILPFGGGL